MAQGMRAEVATAFAAIAYGALLVCVFGFVSLWSGSVPLADEDLGAVPTMLAGVCALLAFAGALLGATRPVRPSYTAVIPVAFAAALTQLVALWLLALAFGAGAGTAIAAAADAVTGGASLVFLLVAVVCGWAGIALRRTSAGRPKWPWERHDEGEE